LGVVATSRRTKLPAEWGAAEKIKKEKNKRLRNAKAGTWKR